MFNIGECGPSRLGKGGLVGPVAITWHAACERAERAGARDGVLRRSKNATHTYASEMTALTCSFHNRVGGVLTLKMPDYSKVRGTSWKRKSGPGGLTI